MQANDELYFSENEESDSYQSEFDDDINDEIKNHVLLFSDNNLLKLQELLETKLNQKNWCKLCDKVLNQVNLKTFLLLPQFLNSPSGLIYFDETCSMPVMDYLFSQFFINNSSESVIPIVKYLFENKLISDGIIHASLVSIIKNSKALTFALFFFLFETGKIDYELIHKENYSKIITTNACLFFLDNCFKGCLEALKMLESIPKILPARLIDHLLTEMKTDVKAIEGLGLAKERHPQAYDGFKKFWFRTKKDCLQKHWLASQLFFNTPARDCIPSVQKNLINSLEEDMLMEFKYQPK